MSMTITMQGFTLAAINDAEETKLRSNFEVKICKVNGSQNIGQGQGQGACLKGMSRTITMHGFTLMAITDAEKTKLRCKN